MTCTPGARVVLALLGVAACSGPDGADRGAGTGSPDGPPDTATDPTPFSVDVVLEPGTACADPTTRDATEFTVTDFTYNEPAEWLEFDGSGTAVGDFDRNGLIDVLVFGHDREEYLEQRVLGTFVAVEGGYMDPAIDLSSGLGGAVADYDGDDDLDIFVSRYMMPDVLLENDGTGWFTDAAAEVGVQGEPDHRSAAATWSDYDNDGDLDLYVAGHGEPYPAGMPPPTLGHPDYLYRHEANGTFTEIGSVLPQRVHDSRGFVPLFLDFDGDGWRDLYLANDLGGAEGGVPCLLTWNRQGTFVLDDHQALLDVEIPAMGIGVGDVNEDGRWDLLLPAWASMSMMMSSQNGDYWINYSGEVGLFPNVSLNQEVAWGDELADMNNDTRLDAVVMFGQLAVPGGYSAPGQPNGLWIQAEKAAEDDQSGVFNQVAPDWGFNDLGISRGLAVADLNVDGWLDVVVPAHDGPTKLYLANCGAGSWLEVALRQPGTLNPDAVGAEIEVTIGDRTLRRPVLAGGTGYGTGLPPIVHFGLGDATAVDAIVVRWPDGEVSTVAGVGSDQKVTIVRE